MKTKIGDLAPPGGPIYEKFSTLYPSSLPKLKLKYLYYAEILYWNISTLYLKYYIMFKYYYHNDI